jgi:hypothetical protein
MPFSRQVNAAAAQALAALTQDAAETLLYKHLNALPADRGMMAFLHIIAGSGDPAVRDLLTELIAERNQLRHAAPTRHVFDSRIDDLARWLFHDGWQLEDGALAPLGAAVEEATGVRDRLLTELAASGLDGDGAIQQALNDAATSFNANPPDFNDSSVKSRLALETIARRGAVALAQRRGLQHGDDRWGPALLLLRQTGVIDLDEEQLIARIYTFVSPGAHIPIGVSAEEWARLARTFTLSAAYFLVKRHLAAP